MKYKSGYKYQLQETEIFEIKEFENRMAYHGKFISLEEGILTLEAGYAFDGPSGPTFDTKSAMRGAAGHDGLYQIIRAGKLSYNQDREIADQYMHLWFVQDGMWEWRAWLWYRGVRLCGWGAATSRPRETFETPESDLTKG